MPNSDTQTEQKALKGTVKDFLERHTKGVFGILDKEGLPTTSLMLYAVDDDLNVYFGTRRSFSKYESMRARPVVALSVIEESADPLQVVDIRGDATEVPKEKLAETLTFFKRKNSAKLYVEDAEDFTMFVLEPHFMRWLDAKHGTRSRVDLDAAH